MKKWRFLGAAGALFVLPTAAIAGLFEDVINVVTAPIRVPTETTIDVLQGRDPTRSAQEAAAAHGRVLQNGVNAAQTVHEQIVNTPRDLISNNLGEDWRQAYDTLTASQRVQTEMGFTSGRFLGYCLQQKNCNLNQLMAMPVAASLRDAYKLYLPYSTPISPMAQYYLMKVLPWQTVVNARVAFGATPDFTIPGFLNYGHRRFGSDHAVTIGNLIVFSRQLNTADRGDWNWLLHELRHTQQYGQYSSEVFESIDGFSGDYLVNYKGFESDAQNSADYWLGQLDQICYYGC